MAGRLQFMTQQPNNPSSKAGLGCTADLSSSGAVYIDRNADSSSKTAAVDRKEYRKEFRLFPVTGLDAVKNMEKTISEAQPRKKVQAVMCVCSSQQVYTVQVYNRFYII